MAMVGRMENTDAPRPVPDAPKSRGRMIPALILWGVAIVGAVFLRDSLTFDGDTPHGPEELVQVPIRLLSIMNHCELP